MTTAINAAPLRIYLISELLLKIMKTSLIMKVKHIKKIIAMKINELTFYLGFLLSTNDLIILKQKKKQLKSCSSINELFLIKLEFVRKINISAVLSRHCFNSKCICAV